MFTEQQKHNANLLSQAMFLQEIATKAEFTGKALNNLLHTPVETLLENPLDIAVLNQAREILSKVNTRKVIDKLVEQTV